MEVSPEVGQCTEGTLVFSRGGMMEVSPEVGQ